MHPQSENFHSPDRKIPLGRDRKLNHAFSPSSLATAPGQTCRTMPGACEGARHSSRYCRRHERSRTRTALLTVPGTGIDRRPRSLPKEQPGKFPASRFLSVAPVRTGCEIRQFVPHDEPLSTALHSIWTAAAMPACRSKRLSPAFIKILPVRPVLPALFLH